MGVFLIRFQKAQSFFGWSLWERRGYIYLLFGAIEKARFGIANGPTLSSLKVQASSLPGIQFKDRGIFDKFLFFNYDIFYL